LFSEEQLNFETTLNNTIVSGNREAEDENSAANNIAGAIEADSSYNLIGPGPVTTANLTGSGNIDNSTNDPGLLPLRNYGGPTKTHLPNANSPAVDAGDPNAVAGQNGIPTFDQRGDGFTRVHDVTTSGGVDIGAVELAAGVPVVADVIISGSNSVHAAYSFSEALGQGINQLMTVPVGGADTIEIVFSEWVNIQANDLWLKGYFTGIQYSAEYEADWNVADFAFDDETFTARWQFDDPTDGNTDPNPFPADKFLIAMNFFSGNFITDLDGNQVDGGSLFIPDVNSMLSPSDIPQGDGDAGGAFVFQFVILPGDLNQDNKVDALDLNAFTTSAATDNTFADGDFDGDGDVDGADLALLQASFNLGLDFTFWF